MASAASDTAIGGAARPFPSTMWSEIVAAGDPSNPECRKAMDRLLTTYWKPVFVYVRARWRKSVEDAKDLTQAFFAHLLGKGYLTSVAGDRRSFRGYLKTALEHFLIDCERAASVRRPETPVLSFEASAESLEQLVPSPVDSPDRAYDRQWFRCLLNDSLEALRKFLAREGKAVYFEVLKAYLIEPALPPCAAEASAASARRRPATRSGKTVLLASGPAPLPSYQDVADLLGVQKTDVGNYIKYCRKVLRQILRERIREYVATDADADRELQEFGRA